MNQVRRLMREVHRRNLWRTLGIFVGGGWAVLQVIDLFIERGYVPEWMFSGALLALIVGLPVVLTTAFVQGGRGETEDPDVHPEDGIDFATVFTWHRAIGGGVLAFAILGFITSVYMVMRVTGIGVPGTLTAQGVFEVGSVIVLADFESSVGEVAPSDLITEALRIDLSQSSAFSLLDPSEVRSTLALMLRDPVQPLTAEVAREVAIREGAAALISGEIGRLGSGFVLTARVIEAESGNTLAPFRVTARSEDDLIDAIDELSARMRSKVGESLRSVASTSSLEAVTTTSLAALRKYSRVSSQLTRGLMSAPVAQSLLQEAVALDSTFASANRFLAIAINNYGGDREVAANARVAAFRHRARLPERERLLVEGIYYTRSTGEEQLAIQAYRALLALDPLDATAVGNLSDAEMFAGNYDEAVRLLRGAPDWTGGAWIWNLMASLAGAGRFEEALAVRDTAEVRVPQDPYHLAGRALLFATSGDPRRARSILAEGPPSTVGPAAAWEAWANALVHVLLGQLGVADTYFRSSVRLYGEHLTPSDQLSTGLSSVWVTSWIAENPAMARSEVDALLRTIDWESLTPFNRNYPLLALTYAINGDAQRTQEMLDRYRNELGSIRDPVARSRLIVAEGLLAVRSRGEAGLPELEAAVEWYRCARCRDFLLGYGYELAGRSDEAIDAYERFLAHPFFDGVDVIMYAFGTTVHEHLGKLHEAVGDSASAAEHYRVFAGLWSEADESLLPRVEHARARATALESPS